MPFVVVGLRTYGNHLPIGCAICCCRPMIQKKLDVLGKAGLTKDDFSSADTTRVKVGFLYFLNNSVLTAIFVFC